LEKDCPRQADLAGASSRPKTQLTDCDVVRRTPRPASKLQSALAALIATLALAACSSVKEAMIERGLPPAYAEGYDDGCASGKEAAGGLFANARKDTTRYGAADGQYAQGWNDGFEKCRDETAALVLDARMRNPSRDK
jgi:hypothetical protein